MSRTPVYIIVDWMSPSNTVKGGTYSTLEEALSEASTDDIILEVTNCFDAIQGSLLAKEEIITDYI